MKNKVMKVQTDRNFILIYNKYNGTETLHNNKKEKQSNKTKTTHTHTVYFTHSPFVLLKIKR